MVNDAIANGDLQAGIPVCRKDIWKPIGGKSLRLFAGSWVRLAP